MEIRQNIANGIKISSDNFQVAYAKRKENSTTPIIEEIWFSGSKKEIFNRLKGGVK